MRASEIAEAVLIGDRQHTRQLSTAHLASPINVHVDAGTIAALKSWRKVQAAERLQMGAGWHGDYVFTHEDGSPLWPQTVTAQFRAHAATLGSRTSVSTGCGTRRQRG